MLLEMFCAGSQGRLLRYRAEGAQVVPGLAEPHNTRVLDWGLPHVRNVVADVLRGCVRALTTGTCTSTWRSRRGTFWTSPTQAERAAWGSFSWEDETDPPSYPVAERYSSLTNVRRLVQRRGGPPVNHWRAGTARLQGQPWRSLLQLRSMRGRQQPRIAR